MSRPRPRGPTDDTADLSVSEVRRRFNVSKGGWEASEQCAQLRDVINSLTIPSKLSKIVGFALSYMYISPGVSRQSMVQHSLLLSLREWLSRGDPEKLPCYVQDPMYSDHDKSILQSEGVAVVDDPMGFLEMDDENVVVSIYPNVFVKEIVADICRPVLIIWWKMEDRYLLMRRLILLWSRVISND